MSNGKAGAASERSQFVRQFFDVGDTSTSLALERTMLAHERTLMAWIRTATSLISFGFTIYKFLDYMREAGGQPESRLFGPREFAMSMIGVGLLSLVLAVADHVRSRRTLRQMAGVELGRSLALVIAAFVAALGVASFVATAVGW